MKINIKIWHFILSLCLIIFIIHIKYIAYAVLLFIDLSKFIFTDFSFVTGQINPKLIDILISVVFIVIFPVYIYRIKNRDTFLNNKLNFTSATILVLLSFFIFAPIIAGSNPDFQKNLNVTKLLPPLSKVKVLYLKNETGEGSNKFAGFLRLKDEVVKRSFTGCLVKFLSRWPLVADHRRLHQFLSLNSSTFLLTLDLVHSIRSNTAQSG